MRIKSLLALAATALSLGVAAPQSANAFHWDGPGRHSGWGKVRTVRHWVYYPRYNHVYVTHPYTDPYAYSYTPRGYYPYYNSQYWGRPRIKRYGGPMAPFYGAWGAPNRNYRRVHTHRRHCCRHHRAHW